MFWTQLTNISYLFSLDTVYILQKINGITVIFHFTIYISIITKTKSIKILWWYSLFLSYGTIIQVCTTSIQAMYSYTPTTNVFVKKWLKNYCMDALYNFMRCNIMELIFLQVIKITVPTFYNLFHGSL